MIGIEVRPPRSGEETKQVTERLRATWGESVARRGELTDPTDGVLLAAYIDGDLIGVSAYAVRSDECEVVAIEALQRRRGVGTALMDSIRDRAWAAGCRRLWLVTTNDNIPALAFYQQWGMNLVQLRVDAMTEARAILKPTIPEAGYRNIPIRHELELELCLPTGTEDVDRSVDPDQSLIPGDTRFFS